MKQCCNYIKVAIILLVVCLTSYPCLVDQIDDSNILVPKQEILQKLEHIKDQTIRNITAIQKFVCPFNKLCSFQSNFTVTKNHSEAARNCCSEIPCSCEPNCVETGSCCVDYNNGFSLMEHESIFNNEEMYECVYPMYRVLHNSVVQERKWLISKCPELKTILVTTNRWYCNLGYDILWSQGHYRDSSPVTDKKHQRSYRNMFCARCHGLKEDDVIFWNATIQGNQPIIALYYTFEEIVDMILNYPYFNIVYIPPENIPAETYNCVEKECDKTGYIEYDQFVEDACLSYKSVYLNRFQNLFCAACQGLHVGYDDCKETSYIFNPQFSYIGILDFNNLEPPTRQRTDLAVTYCPQGYFWDEIMKMCREVACDFLSSLVNNKCQLLYTKIKGYSLVIHLAFINQPEKLLQYTVASVKELYSNITMNLYPIFHELLDNSSLHTFERIFQFIVIPLIELEHMEYENNNFANTKILGFAIDIFLDPNPAIDELYDLKEILEDARKIHDIESYESYYALDIFLYLNMMITLSRNFSSEIHDLFNNHIADLETELETEVHRMSNITDYEESTSHSTSLFNLSDFYSGIQNNSPYIPFYFHDEYPDDEYWNNLTTLPTMAANETDKINNSLKIISENQEENVPNITRNSTRYFLPATIIYPWENDFSNKIFDYIEVNPHILCTQVKFDLSEVAIVGSQVTFLKSNLTLRINQANFCADDFLDKLCVCVETYKDAVRKYHSTNTFENTSQTYTKVYSTEFITSVSFSLLSIGCNIVTIVTYLILKQLRTTPGLITMTLTFHLLIFQSVYILSNSLDITNIKALCTISGIAVHFTFLLYIFWLNTSCFHMYNHFTRMGIKFFNQTRFHPKKLILKYSMYVYTMSFSFVALNILVSMASTNWSDLGYGSSTCYIKSSLMIGLSVGLPLGFVLLTNIILFSRTTYIAIKGLDLSITRSGGIDDKQYLTAFLKLSILMGLTWIFGFIHQLVKVKAIGYLFIILNAGQGVLITFAFVCNSHVLIAIRSKFTKY